MALKKISDLTVAGTVALGDRVPVVQGGETKQADAADLANARRFKGIRLTWNPASWTVVDLAVTSWNATIFHSPPGSFWDISSRTRITIPESGYYLFDWGFQVGSTTAASMRLHKNGAVIGETYAAAAYTRPHASFIEYCVPGDYFETSYDHVSGSTVYVTTGTHFGCAFMGY